MACFVITDVDFGVYLKSLEIIGTSIFYNTVSNPAVAMIFNSKDSAEKYIKDNLLPDQWKVAMV